MMEYGTHTLAYINILRLALMINLTEGSLSKTYGRTRVTGKGVSILLPKNGHPCRAILRGQRHAF
jgi:hypothetical protein